MNLPLSEKARILVTRTDRIGDLVVSTPIFEAIKKHYPRGYLAVCVFSEHRELVEGNPFIDEIILYEKNGNQKRWWGQFCFAKKIRSKKFDAVIHLHATNRMHLMGLLAGIPVRVGYDRRAPWALSHVHSYDKKEGEKHESAYLFDLLSLAVPELDGKNIPWPTVLVSEKSRLSVANLLTHEGVGENTKIAVIHPAASDFSKIWPAERFAELLKQLAEKNFIWIAVGNAVALTQAQKIEKLSGVAIKNFCGRLSLGQLAALCARAEIIISNDSGPAHIAAAVETPTVSIFGRWQPGLNATRWRPLGKKTVTVTPAIDWIPVEQREFTYIESVTVEQVLDAVEKVGL